MGIFDRFPELSTLTPEELAALMAVDRSNEWLRSVLCTLARRGVAYRRRFPERAQRLLDILAPFPYYKAGQFLFDLMEWEDFMLDGDPPPVLPTVLDGRARQQLRRLLNAIREHLDGAMPDDWDGGWPYGAQEIINLTDEDLPALEPGFYLYQDVVLGIAATELVTEPPEDEEVTGRLQLLLAMTAVAVTPGEQVDAPVTLVNDWPTDDRFRLELEGLPAGWTVLTEEELQLAAGGNGSSLLTFQPPAASDVAPEAMPFILRAISATHPARRVEVGGTLHVRPFRRLTVTMAPRVVAHGKTTALLVHNGGNIVVQAAVAGLGPTERVTFDGERENVTLAPGTEEQVRLTVRGEKRPWFGMRHYIPFEIGVTPAGGSTLVVDGQLDVHPIFPFWLLWLIPLLLICCLATYIIYPPPVPCPPFCTPTPTATATVGPTATITSTATPTSTTSPSPTSTASPTISPTATATPTATPSLTPSSTPSLTPSATASITVTPTPSRTPTLPPSFDGPLRMTVEIVWEIDSNDPRLALANVTIAATGGDGNYTYYRDDIRQLSSRFIYVWRSCSVNPVTFRVDSGDGQTIRVERFEQAPCP